MSTRGGVGRRGLGRDGLLELGQELLVGRAVEPVDLEDEVGGRGALLAV